ncbi:MAG: Uma2 family endonuclease [Geitlerinemataceae cyanobacterium]
MSVQLLRRKFTVQEYHLTIDAGIFGEDERIELIEGEIIQMAVIGKRHATTVRRLIHRLRDLPKNQAILDVQDPVELTPRTEPQPDVVLLRFREDYYATAHPTPADVLLLVEVADSSIDYDRQVKTPIYARSNIAEVWIVDLIRDCLTVYREPTADGYGFQQDFDRGQSVTPLAFPEFEVSLDFILGDRS